MGGWRKGGLEEREDRGKGGWQKTVEESIARERERERVENAEREHQEREEIAEKTARKEWEETFERIDKYQRKIDMIHQEFSKEQEEMRKEREKWEKEDREREEIAGGNQRNRAREGSISTSKPWWEKD